MDAQGLWSRQIGGSGPSDTYELGDERWQVRRSTSRRWYVWWKASALAGERMVHSAPTLKLGRQWILEHVVAEQQALEL